MELFPVEINRADYELLLRVPGIGVRSAQRIVRGRRHGHLAIDDLARLGVVMKRARYFITARGRHAGGCAMESDLLRSRLIGGRQRGGMQLELPLSQALASEERVGLVSGEL
jgi:predicted DNA-binding helix-hairpin-helix protein